MAEAEYHVASFVVRANPKQVAAVTDSLVTFEGVEVHAEKEGRLVVTAEAESIQTLAKLTDAIQALPNILSVAPVYHEFTNAEDSPPDIL